MLWTIAAFELRKRLSLLSTYIYLLLFFACGVISIFAVGGAFSNVTSGAGSERIHANAPIVLQGMIASISYIGLLMSAAVFGQAVHQDFESRTDSILYTYPIRKSSYLGGRFLGAFIFVAVVFLFIGLGVLAGAHFPFLIDKSLFGPTPIKAYFWPYVVTVFPNLLFTGALFFALGALGRKMMPVYLGAVVIVLGYIISRMLLSDVENLTVAGYLDPFGGSANAIITRYWSVADKNANLIPLRGLLLANRLLWSGLGVLALVITATRFRMGHLGAAEKKQADVAKEKAIDSSGLIPTVPVVRSNLASLITLTKLGFAETIKNTYFAVLVFAAMAIALASMGLAGRLLGTKTWPVTNTIAAIGEGAFSLFMLIIITFYSGEIIWRERDLNLDQITDALPIPTWVTYLSKLLSLCLVPVLLLVAIIFAGVVFQTSQGYFHYELGLYIKRLYLFGLPNYLFICVLAFFVQSMVQNKYVGHFLMVAYYLLTPFMDKIGLEHGLFKYGDTPSATYSDMNGFGHFAKPVALYDLYWSGFALIFAVVGLLFWSRGTEVSFKARVSIARARFTALPRLGIAAGLLLALIGGGVIYYNEDVLNIYMTSHQREQLRVDHEKKYKQFETAPQPRITAVHVDYELYPESETLNVSGSYQLLNKTSEPVTTVYIEYPGEQKFDTMTLDGAPAAESDLLLGFATFKLQKPLAPGEKTELRFVARYHDVGFKDRGNRTELAANGTFFNNGSLPHIGYDRGDELEQDNDRKKYDLAPRERLPDLHDKKALGVNLISHDADWIEFDGTVSTSEDQLAILPGTLVKEWTENGRRHFHYKMDAPILDFFALNSARYAVRKDEWNGIALEIDYHPPHTFDLDEMIHGMKDSLGYYTKNFGPFQFHQLRIVEFPKYADFAQSFPSVIPYSESIGFILRTDPSKKEDIDLPYYVTAHEVAHQWWGHQVVGADLQGVTMLDETLAQYSALMVMKARFGEPQMRRFLRYELDQYLMGRAVEQKKEVPLLRVENQQYIHYRKGSLVMYALQDYIGEDKVNQALKAFLDTYKFKGPPYPTSEALYDEFVKVTPPELQYVLEDLFKKIILYDNRAISAVATKLPGGKYQLTLKVSVKKLQASAQGAETEVPANDYIDIGAIDADGAPIALERRQLKSGESTVTLVADKLPAKAGIDPVNKLIDRDPKDNLVAVTGL